MGVLVFVLVLTSLDDKNTMHLMRAEVPGPEADKLVPKVRGTAKILYGMYLALTLIEVGFLLAGGMNLYDSAKEHRISEKSEVLCFFFLQNGGNYGNRIKYYGL